METVTRTGESVRATTSTDSYRPYSIRKRYCTHARKLMHVCYSVRHAHEPGTYYSITVFNERRIPSIPLQGCCLLLRLLLVDIGCSLTVPVTEGVCIALPTLP